MHEFLAGIRKCIFPSEGFRRSYAHPARPIEPSCLDLRMCLMPQATTIRMNCMHCMLTLVRRRKGKVSYNPRSLQPRRWRHQKAAERMIGIENPCGVATAMTQIASQVCFFATAPSPANMSWMNTRKANKHVMCDAEMPIECNSSAQGVVADNAITKPESAAKQVLN